MAIYHDIHNFLKKIIDYPKIEKNDFDQLLQFEKNLLEEKDHHLENKPLLQKIEELISSLENRKSDPALETVLGVRQAEFFGVLSRIKELSNRVSRWEKIQRVELDRLDPK